MLNLKAMTADANNFNNLLEKCILNNFQHRLDYNECKHQ